MATITFNADTESLQAVPDEVAIKVLFDYPLTNHVWETYVGPLTCGELYAQIMETYARIYKEENETCTSPAGQHDVFILNRSRTNGKHGIWGHTLEQLDVWGLIPFPTQTNVYTVGVDS